MKKIVIFFTLLCYGLIPLWAAEVVPVEGIYFTDPATAQQLYVGDILKAEVSFTPENATNKSLSWSSNSPSIASVTNDGVITALAYGVSRITATTDDGGHTATVTIAVYNDIRVTGVTLGGNQATMDRLDEYQFTATIFPSNARYKEVTWSSSNPEVAQIDTDGLVTSYINGSTVITVTTVDGAFTDQCELTVVDPDLLMECFLSMKIGLVIYPVL